MPHDTTLIATIVAGLVFAFIGGFVASKARLPPLVGYLLAGVAVGLFTPGFVADETLAGQLSEIGVPADVRCRTAFFDQRPARRAPDCHPWSDRPDSFCNPSRRRRRTVMGWSFGAGLAFGVALSVASTVVLLRALEE